MDDSGVGVSRRVVVGSDEANAVGRAVIDQLTTRGMTTTAVGPLADQPGSWVAVAASVARAVADGEADLGVLMCYTGTGVSIAANKIPGVRAALCTDAATATGARRWNDANVLVMSYRLASETVAGEIVEAFLAAEPDPSEADALVELASLDADRAAGRDARSTGD